MLQWFRLVSDSVLWIGVVLVEGMEKEQAMPRLWSLLPILGVQSWSLLVMMRCGRVAVVAGDDDAVLKML